MELQPGSIRQKKDEHCDQRATRQPSSPNATQYQNGIDFHFDWASHFLSKQLFVGMVGYAYQQVTDDIGTAPFLNGFKSRVFGFGPQLGYLFPIGDKQGYEFQGLQGVCLRESTGRLERVVDLRDLECRADINSYADQAFDYEVEPRNRPAVLLRSAMSPRTSPRISPGSPIRQ